jgi:hypothetical protein
MKKKFISSILVVALLNLLGCYSLEPVTVPEYKFDDDVNIHVTTIDTTYYFIENDYVLRNDTLFAITKKGGGATMQINHVVIPIEKIETVEVKKINTLNTLLILVPFSVLVGIILANAIGPQQCTFNGIEKS